MFKIGDIIYPKGFHHYFIEKDVDGFEHHLHLHRVVVEMMLTNNTIEIYDILSST